MADRTVTTSTDPQAAGAAAGLSTADISQAGQDESQSRVGGMLRAGKDEAYHEAKAMVRDVADRQRTRAASTVDNMAGALHRAARDLGSGNEAMGRYTEMAAERLDEMADYLRQARLDDMMRGAEDFARRQPYWFVGGAMAAGFLLARFVKTSGAAQQDMRRGLSGMEETSRGMAASSAVGYGTSTEAGTYPPTTATTQPLSSAPGVSPAATTTTTTTSTIITGKEP